MASLKKVSMNKAMQSRKWVKHLLFLCHIIQNPTRALFALDLKHFGQMKSPSPYLFQSCFLLYTSSPQTSSYSPLPNLLPFTHIFSSLTSSLLLHLDTFFFSASLLLPYFLLPHQLLVRIHHLDPSSSMGEGSNGWVWVPMEAGGHHWSSERGWWLGKEANQQVVDEATEVMWGQWRQAWLATCGS